MKANPYEHDGDGNRVLKTVAGVKTTYFRNAATGEVIQEYVNGALDRNYNYFN